MFSYSKGFRKKIVFLTILKTISSLITIALALVVKSIIDAAINQNLRDVKILGFLVVMTLVFKLFLSKFTSVYKRNTSEALHNKLQFQTIASYYNNQWLYIDGFKTGDLITRATNDISQIVSALLGIFPSVFSLLVQLATAFYILSSYDWLIAFVAFILGPLTIIISWLIGHKLKALQHEVQTSVSDLRSNITESVQNIELIKTYNIESNRLDALSVFQDIKKALIYKKSIYKAIATGMVDLGYTFGYLGAILIGAFKLYNKEISFGTFTAFSQLVTHIQNPMYGITKTIPSLLTVLSSVERISEFKVHHHLKEEDTPFDTIEAIEFDLVSFAYKERKKVLDDLSFTINKGEKIGLKGPSGEGKTTILRLLLGLIEPNQGKILIHYKDQDSEILNSNISNIFSYVPQKNSLFSGTILDNLKLGNNDASQDDIDKALKTAQIDTFINDLPHGLNTHVGERLRGLSEGQAQRICIARALLHQAPFLILDEATSALDVETERKIVASIKENYTHKGLIAVTHRTQILNICDHIYEYKNFNLKKINQDI